MIESENIQELELKLIEANKYVASIKQRISFRGKGQSARWTSELNKAKKQRDLIANDIKRKSVAKETEVFFKDYEEQERIRKEADELAKEKKRVYALFEKYKENPTISIPIKQKKEKPDFSYIGNEIIDLNAEALIQAEKIYNSAKQKASKRSAVGTGGRTAQLQKARNQLDKAMFDLTHLPILTNFYDLRTEKKYLDTVIKEQENEIEQVSDIISKVEKDIVLFKKYGLIKLKK